MRWAVLLIAALVLWPQDAHAACSNPAGVTGAVVYNTTYNVPQYCDSSDNWIAMVGSDPAPQCPSGIVSCGGKADERVVFVHNAADSAVNIGGISGADAACQSQAVAAGLGGTYLAWLADSDPNSAPAVRFEKSSVPYVRVTGVKVADNWTDLTDGSLDAAISRNAWGNAAPLQNTRSNIAIDGTQKGAAATDQCSDWTSGGGTGNVGNRSQTGNAWTDSSNIGCGVGAQRHYCFEQGNRQQTQIVPSGLVGHWRLDETSGTFADSSGNGNDGTQSGGVEYASAGVIGNAAGFDGVDDVISVPDSDTLDIIGDLTIAFWADLSNGYPAADANFLGKSGCWNVACPFEIYMRPSGRIGMTHNDGSAGQESVVTAASAIPANQWSYVTIVRKTSDSTWNVYIDGTLFEAGLTYTRTPVANSSALLIGDNAVPDAPFAGRLDDVRIYNRALSAAEIQEVYEARDGIRYNPNQRTAEYFDGNRFVSMTPDWPDVRSGLIAHWKLDETSGTTAYDTIGSNDGTMNNGLDAANDSIPGPVGPAMRFDGLDDGINTSVSVASLFRNDYTVSMWVQYRDFISAGSRISLARTYQGFSSERFDFSITNIGAGAGNRLIEFKNRYNIDITCTISSANLFGNWKHIVHTRDDNGDLQIFVDGSLCSSNSSGYVGDITLQAAQNDRFRLVGSYNGSNILHKVDYDDIRLYDRVLSANEIQRLYNMGAPVGSSTALPQGCPNIGDVCDDGTIYAGLSPDGNVEMFTTPKDAGNLAWNDANLNFSTTGTTSTTDGDGNTKTIVVTDSDDTTGGFQPHNAAQVCYDLVSNGSDDWYLPAEDELNVLYTNKTDLNTGSSVPFVEGTYWSSTEASNTNGRRQHFDTGAVDVLSKSVAQNVRCVRKGPAPRCANPYGLEGAMVFNTTHNVVQFCDGARWIAIGKTGP